MWLVGRFPAPLAASGWTCIWTPTRGTGVVRGSNVPCATPFGTGGSPLALGCPPPVGSLPPVDAEPPRAAARARESRFDLRPGSPDVRAFPAAAWLRALRRAIATAPSLAYDYGDPRGRIELRNALSGYRQRGPWQLSFDLAPADRVGEYQGVFGTGVTVARTLGSLVLTSLLVG